MHVLVFLMNGSILIYIPDRVSLMWMQLIFLKFPCTENVTRRINFNEEKTNKLQSSLTEIIRFAFCYNKFALECRWNFYVQDVDRLNRRKIKVMESNPYSMSTKSKVICIFLDSYEYCNSSLRRPALYFSKCYD